MSVKKTIPQVTEPVMEPVTAISAQSTKPPKDWTRHILALVYVIAFLIIVAFTLVLMLWHCYTISDIKDILLAESGILSGPLGFIIGFYFKEEFTEKE